MTMLDDLRGAAARKLDDQRHRAEFYQDYYDNEQGVVALLDTEERRTFKAFLDECQANWAELVVNAVAERLNVTGFRFGGSEAEADAAWAIWQASGMDADSGMAHTDALVTGTGFALVQPDDANPTGVSISLESPEEACVLYEPGNRRRRRAGFKRFHDELNDPHRVTEVLILPDVIATWQPGTGEPEVAANPAGTVGLIELVPQPRTRRLPRSELHSATPIVDRIQTTLFNRCVAVDYGANRQIWASGVKMARQVTRDEDGTEHVKPVNPFNTGSNRLLIAEHPESRFGSFPESTLAGYIGAVEQDVQQLAAITQTPPHYLLGSMVNLSADAIKAAETGLVSKIRLRSRYLGEGWEEVMRIALGLVGNPAATDVAAEVIWADFETRSEGQRVDALVKMATLGVPRRVLWERWGTSPQEIERWEQLAQSEQPEGVPA
jgi:hypothetical protein